MEASTWFKRMDGRALPFALLLLNLIIKFVFIDSLPIGHDEPHTIHCASLDEVWRIIMTSTHTQNPPLLEIMLHYWMELFGTSLISIRALPVIFSSLTVLVVYRIGKEFFNPNVALLAALIFTFSDLHILHSHNIRVYSLYTLLSCVSMYSFLRSTQEPSNKRQLVLLALVNAVNLYVHFFTAFVILVQGVSVLAFKELRRTLFKKYFFAGLGTLALFLPYLLAIATRTRLIEKVGEGKISFTSPAIGSLYGHLVKFLNSPFMSVTFALIFIVVASSYLYKYHRHRSLRLSLPCWVVLIWSIGLYGFLFLFSQEIPIFISRYLIFVSVGFYLLFALSVDALVRKQAYRSLLSAFVIVSMIFTCHPTKDNYSKRGDRTGLIQYLLGTKELEKYEAPEDLSGLYVQSRPHPVHFLRGKRPLSKRLSHAERSPFERSARHPGSRRIHWKGSPSGP
jgi:4-amino-4-deoxy-L-arabinose transferase-like glycosyltransferase